MVSDCMLIASQLASSFSPIGRYPPPPRPPSARHSPPSLMRSCEVSMSSQWTSRLRRMRTTAGWRAAGSIRGGIPPPAPTAPFRAPCLRAPWRAPRRQLAVGLGAAVSSARPLALHLACRARRYESPNRSTAGRLSSTASRASRACMPRACMCHASRPFARSDCMLIASLISGLHVPRVATIRQVML